MLSELQKEQYAIGAKLFETRSGTEIGTIIEHSALSIIAERKDSSDLIYLSSMAEDGALLFTDVDGAAKWAFVEGVH